MTRTEKDQIIESLSEQFKKYNNIYIADSSGLSANKVNEFRGLLFKNGLVMQVAKNTLIKKAMEASGRDFGGMMDTLKGTSALIFSEDIKSPANALKEFSKKSDKPSLKGAYIDTDVFIGANSLNDLLKLKSKQELIGEIIGLLQSPAKQVISALQSGGNTLSGLVKALSERPE